MLYVYILFLPSCYLYEVRIKQDLSVLPRRPAETRAGRWPVFTPLESVPTAAETKCTANILCALCGRENDRHSVYTILYTAEMPHKPTPATVHSSRLRHVLFTLLSMASVR